VTASRWLSNCCANKTAAFDVARRALAASQRRADDLT
jgi:hypothetical protein